MQPLLNKIVWVTGAGSGIGEAAALTLAKAGGAVVLTGRRREPLETVAHRIRAEGGTAHVEPGDLMDPDAVKRIGAAINDKIGRLDILVNNAGIEQVCPSLDVDEALWDRILDTNLKGAFFCAQGAAKVMQAQGKGGAILNLCSLTSEVGVPTAVPYGSSKSGLLGMTRALAVEWAPLGIRVNGLGPGYFRTALTEVFYQNDAWQQSTMQKIPLARFGRLQDLIGAAVFLSSDAAAYVTGIYLPVDGGYLASI